MRILISVEALYNKAVSEECLQQQRGNQPGNQVQCKHRQFRREGDLKRHKCISEDRSLSTSSVVQPSVLYVSDGSAVGVERLSTDVDQNLNDTQ